jgi:predicted phage terminase large subunit-like protein
MKLSDTLKLSLTRRSLGRFASAMMPSFETDPFHQLIIDNLEFLLNGKIRKLAIITPPRHGKSTLGNVITPAFALGRNPTETIITVSYGSELSEGFGRRVRNILGDPAFHQVFPNCQLSPDSAAAYRFTTTAGGEYSAVGRGGPVTGRGASLLILDDLVKDSSEANSDTVCRGIIEWLQHVAFTRLTPNGRILAIATRWSERDPMGWILQQHGWTVLHLPALAESAADPLARKPGEALWPSRYPVEALVAIRADVGGRVFQALYQGNVSASQGAVFKRQWFRHYREIPEQFRKLIQSWDTAYKTGTSDDYSVCTTWGVTENAYYLLSAWRERVEFPGLKRQVEQQAEQWRPHVILVEDRASGQSLIQELKSATTFPVVPIKVDHDKETRASAVTAFFEAGKVLFPEGAAWLPDFEDELAGFPDAVHDDIVDSITQALNYLRGDNGVYGVLELLKKGWDGFVDTWQNIKQEPHEGHVERKTLGGPVAPPLAVKALSSVTTLQPVKRYEGPVLEPCPDCACSLAVIVPGGQRRCQQCGKQWWGPAGPPEVARVTRGDYLSGKYTRRNW